MFPVAPRESGEAWAMRIAENIRVDAKAAQNVLTLPKTGFSPKTLHAFTNTITSDNVGHLFTIVNEELEGGADKGLKVTEFFETLLATVSSQAESAKALILAGNLQSGAE
jgi:hypothetical protein